MSTSTLISSASLSSVIYQARGLIAELQHINRKGFPEATCTIRDVFACLADYVLEELLTLRDDAEPHRARDQGSEGRVRQLARVLHLLYSYLRYLLASSPRQSPPSIQVALDQLTQAHFPTADNGRPVCVVRPQWKYNLTYVPLTWYLRQHIPPAVLDPTGRYSADSIEDILAALWRRKQPGPKESLPRQLAVLSFAGLDTHNTLFYPLLAHELGHFIDYSYESPLHLQEPIRGSVEIKHDEVYEAFRRVHGDDFDEQQADAAWNRLVQLTDKCVQELLADALALRMLGLGFFLAHAEFLKMVAAWPQETISESGYPGIKFRLWCLLHHLLGEEAPSSVVAFLQDRKQTEPIADWLLTFLSEWRARLESSARASVSSSPIHQLAEAAIRKSLPSVYGEARRVVPDQKAAYLSGTFFDRVRRLQADLPPSWDMEGVNSFPEIMAAAWTYQLLYGNEREANLESAEKQYEEHEKTARLILKAIELVPFAQARRPAEREKLTEKVITGHGVLSAAQILARTQLPVGDPLGVAILPFSPGHVQGASLDVRLGHWFAYAKRTSLGMVTLEEHDENLLLSLGTEEVFVPNGEQFLIHPGDFVLGATLEFVALPADVMAFVEGRSGLGRKGLIVATATQIAPGFHGVVVLELANTGTVPLGLRPGMTIAQLVLHMMSDPVSDRHLYRGRHHCQIKP